MQGVKGTDPGNKEISRNWYNKNKELCKQRARDRYYSNKPRKLEYASNYRKNNLDKSRKSAQASRVKNGKSYDLKKCYGITIEVFDELLAATNGRCPICKRPFSKLGNGHANKNSKPTVDHCHETGKIKGVICGYCNISQGFMGTPEAVLELYQYMLKHKVG